MVEASSLKFLVPVERQTLNLSIRDGFGQGLLELGKSNPKIVALTADVSESTRVEAYAKAYPERFIEVGVSEQNLIGVAAGLALAGKTPFLSAYAAFSPGRNWDQIRVSICYSELNVKIVGAHAGLSVGPDGATHQALEDIALMRVLPNMTVIVPADSAQARLATIALGQHTGPAYLRLARAASPVITTSKTLFVIGQAQPIVAGTDVVIFACGLMLARAIEAAKLLQGRLSVAVVNIHTIKPIDVTAVVHWAKQTGAVVTAEEHQINGGLGGTIAELLGEKLPVPLERVGVNDHFGESGQPEELLDHYGLSVEDVVAAVEKVYRRKNAR